MVNIKPYLSRLYTGRMDIMAVSKTKDSHGITKTEFKTVQSDVPCRLSYDRKTVNNADNGDLLIQEIQVICSPDVDIPEGSRLKVTQAGRTETFDLASPPAVYDNHQEVRLTLLNRRA